MLAVERMSDIALWQVLCSDCDDQLAAAGSGTNVEAYVRARRIKEMVDELRVRGAQLGLGI